jgi:hypothetical protein
MSQYLFSVQYQCEMEGNWLPVCHANHVFPSEEEGNRVLSKIYNKWKQGYLSWGYTETKDGILESMIEDKRTKFVNAGKLTKNFHSVSVQKIDVISPEELQEAEDLIAAFTTELMPEVEKKYGKVLSKKAREERVAKAREEYRVRQLKCQTEQGNSSKAINKKRKEQGLKRQTDKEKRPRMEEIARKHKVDICTSCDKYAPKYGALISCSVCGDMVCLSKACSPENNGYSLGVCKNCDKDSDEPHTKRQRTA